MEFVELAFPPQACAEVKERARAFCESLGKTPVEVPDTPGFIVNRLLFPYLFDAVELLSQTGIEPADVDRCMTLGAGMPMGPLALLDFVGLDVAQAIGESIGPTSPQRCASSSRREPWDARRAAASTSTDGGTRRPEPPTFRELLLLHRPNL